MFKVLYKHQRRTSMPHLSADSDAYIQATSSHTKLGWVLARTLSGTLNAINFNLVTTDGRGLFGC